MKSFCSRFSLKIGMVIGAILGVLSSPGNVVAKGPMSTIEEIAIEATKRGRSESGRPLPLFSHWNTGKVRYEGWAPEHQMRLIEDGHSVLPWFEMPDDRDDRIENDPVAFARYYEKAFKKARDLRLPIVLVGSQWERYLSGEEFLKLPPSRNPNVVTAGGTVEPKLSPFGPVELWRKAGFSIVNNPLMKRLQEWYPNPPRVIFLSNNEHPKLLWREADKSRDFIDRYGYGRGDQFKRTVFLEGWIERYRALISGMRDGLISASWKSNALFVGYKAFGWHEMGRYPRWLEGTLYAPGRLDALAEVWNGTSVAYYVYGWNASGDFTLWSPQIEAMNLVFQQEEILNRHPEAWFEMSVWDGYEPDRKAVDKRRYYAGLSQTYTPDRYAGVVQFGMWLLRPRVVREYRGYKQPWDDCEPYFRAVLDAVDLVHTDPRLREWWRNGVLVANTRTNHPYQLSIPEEYRDKDRWFLLDVDTNQALDKTPMALKNEVGVYALALRRNREGGRQWLVYAHSPLGTRELVKINIPDFSQIVVDVPVSGTFVEVDEVTGRVIRLH